MTRCGTTGYARRTKLVQAHRTTRCGHDLPRGCAAASLIGTTAGSSAGITHTVQRDLRRSSTMNALIYEQIAR